MPKIKIAINGFGRIGRSAFKIAFEKKNIEVAAINDLTDTRTLAHLLKYDTAYGKYEKDVSHEDGHLIVEGKKIRILSERDPARLPWEELKVDVVLECTGVFTKDGAARKHIEAGAKKVIVSAPTKGEGGVSTYLLGVNADRYGGEEVISNASCTTNCVGPVIAVLEAAFGVEKALMTTVHGYTSTQNLQDGPHKDMRRARAAAQNIVPTSTGAAIAVTEAIPGLKNRFDGKALRVPVITGSITDFTVLLKRPVTAEEVNDAFRKASREPIYEGILAVAEDPIVSSDVIGSTYSAIFDPGLTMVVDGNLVKVFAWYDNEWGYANRLVEQIFTVIKK